MRKGLLVGASVVASVLASLAFAEGQGSEKKALQANAQTPAAVAPAANAPAKVSPYAAVARQHATAAPGAAAKRLAGQSPALRARRL